MESKIIKTIANDENENISCKCKSCRKACQNKPGWFLPGEVEKVANHLGLPLNELFNKYLGVDWFEVTDKIKNTTFVLARTTTNMQAGTEYNSDPRGCCTFYKDGLCKIYDVWPFECRNYDHNIDHEDVQQTHLEIAQAWNKPEHHTQIVELLGREPIESEYEGSSIFDMLSSLRYY